MSVANSKKASLNGSSAKITFYTNHACPWAHRVHIFLAELEIPYEEVIIDLSKPREDWYLKINHHGQIPSIRYTDSNFTATIIESSIIPQFLADMFPSPLLPLPDSSPTAPLFRVRMALFVHAFSNSVNPKFFDALFSPVAEAKTKSTAILSAIRDEIEPLLHDASPFFGGSGRLTMAEVMTAPFVLRLHVFCKAGILPEELGTGLAKLEKYSKWAERVMDMESVMGVWDEEFMIGMIRGRIEEARAAAATNGAN